MMSGYRRGAVFGLTIAEIFILLVFLLLVALLGLILPEESQEEISNRYTGSSSAPNPWIRPNQIEALVKANEAARRSLDRVHLSRLTAESERNEVKKELAIAIKDLENSESAHAIAEREKEQAMRERDQAKEELVVASKALKDSESAHAIAEREKEQAMRERDRARYDLSIYKSKGDQPPCWYKVVPDGNKTREKRHYIFNVAIYENGIELASRPAPLGGAADDGGGTYEEERKRLKVENLPYGKRLSDKEFEKAVKDLVEKGKNHQVRTYECIFSVQVWDMTPVYAKERWQIAHDELIEGRFNAYTVKDHVWPGDNQ